MRLPMETSRRRRISLTSLIDVIFLLLLFFMLSSTFSRFNAFELNTGGGGASVSSEKLPILLRLRDDSFSLNGEELSAEDAQTRLIDLAGQSQKKAVLVVIGETKTQTLVTWLEAIRSVPELSVTLVRQ